MNQELEAKKQELEVDIHSRRSCLEQVTFSHFCHIVILYNTVSSNDSFLSININLWTCFVCTTARVPARVVHGHITLAPCAVERDARSVPQVRSSNPSRGPVRRICLCKSNYLKIILMHMMIREIIPGRKQRAQGCRL